MNTLEQQLDSLNLTEKINPQAWALLMSVKETRADSFLQVAQDNDAIATQIQTAIGNDWEALAALYYQMGKHTKNKRLRLYGLGGAIALSGIGAAVIPMPIEGVLGILLIGSVILQFMSFWLRHSNDRKDIILELVEQKIQASKSAAAP